MYGLFLWGEKNTKDFSSGRAQEKEFALSWGMNPQIETKENPSSTL
jgi:hypothetical protein